MSWKDLAVWWLDEVGSDPAYEEEVTPVALELLEVEAGARYLDVGCGEGRLMRAINDLGGLAVGIDAADGLLSVASRHGPVVRGILPDLRCFSDGAFDGALISLVLEHIPGYEDLLAEVFRVVVSHGTLVAVVNHPFFTAPQSAPIQEPDEVLWRTGQYLEIGHTDEPVGAGIARFHHRPVGVLLTAAASCGWSLQAMVERGAGPGQVRRHPALELQRHIPRLAAFRWQKR